MTPESLFHADNAPFPQSTTTHVCHMDDIVGKVEVPLFKIFLKDSVANLVVIPAVLCEVPRKTETDRGSGGSLSHQFWLLTKARVSPSFLSYARYQHKGMDKDIGLLAPHGRSAIFCPILWGKWGGVPEILCLIP
ncbi:hypothetical protein MHU86_24990 [Fragilaria crotonensis]|nr:hypothetical protein MHU86_24990 [Fragilaria crotonensis]